MTKEELLPLWQADAENLAPGIRLFNENEMAEAILKARHVLKKNGMVIESDVGVTVAVLRNMIEHREDVWGIQPHFWWMKACTLLLDDIELHPWMQVLWKMFDDARGKRVLDTIHGGASTGKSEFFGALALTTGIVFASHSHAYVTSPWKEYGSDKVWKVITRRVDYWEKERPEWMDKLVVDIRKTTDSIAIHNCKKGEAGVSNIEFVAVQNAASIQGKKREGQLFNNDPRHGVMLAIGDEFLENLQSSLSEAVGNFISNSNAYAVVGCNPKPEKVQDPRMMIFSAPVDKNMADMDEDKDFVWKTRRGKCVRFCMANSPNRYTDEAGEPPAFPYLLHKEQAESQANWDDRTDKAQVRAWAWISGATGSLLSNRDCERDEVRGPVRWKDAAPVKTMFVDLAFGGQDACSYLVMEQGKDWEGNHVLQVERQTTIKVKKRWKPTVEELAEYRKLHAKPALIDDLKPGEDAPGDGNHHVTYEILKLQRDLGIPKGNISYDSSMKPDVHYILSAALGQVKWWYDGNRSLTAEEDRGSFPLYPFEHLPDGTLVKWSEKVTKIISAAWYFCEGLILNQKINNLEKAELGWRELIARPRDTTSAGKGLKKDVRAKDKLPRSPTYGECLCLCAYFSVKYAGALPDLFATAKSVQQETFVPEAYGFAGDERGLDVECFA